MVPTEKTSWETGDPCPVKGCDGYLKVYHTKVKGESAWRTQRFHCAICGYTDGMKRVVPVKYFPRRRIRSKDWQHRRRRRARRRRDDD